MHHIRQSRNTSVDPDDEDEVEAVQQADGPDVTLLLWNLTGSLMSPATEGL